MKILTSWGWYCRWDSRTSYTRPGIIMMLFPAVLMKCAGYYVDDCSNGICPALNLDLLKKIFTPMRGRYAPRQMRKRVEIRLLRAARLLNQIYQIQGNRAGRSQSQKQSTLLRRIPQRIHQLEQNLQINQKKPCTK